MTFFNSRPSPFSGAMTRAKDASVVAFNNAREARRWVSALKAWLCGASLLVGVRTVAAAILAFPPSDNVVPRRKRSTAVAADSLLHSWALRRAVVRLFLGCCPAHVIRLVSARVIDSVERISESWLGAEVSEERFKRCAPRFTDSDASSAVSSVVVRGWVVAAFLHSDPRAILRRLTHSMCDSRHGSYYTAVNRAVSFL